MRGERIRAAIGDLVGRPRRWRYLERLPKGGIGAEIGVFRGEFTPDLLRVVRPRRLHLIDGWWTLYGDRYPDWGAYTDHGQLTTRHAHEEAQTRAGEGCDFHVGDDLELLPGFADGYFDWVYLDSSHQYEHTLAELELLRTKVRPGGVIMGDDWRPDPDDVNHGVYRAVNELAPRHGWQVDLDPVFGQWSIVLPEPS